MNTNPLITWGDLPPRPRRGTRPHVLLVDDDEDYLALASRALAEEGFHVQTARTAGEAVMRAVADPPDLILLDIILRGGGPGVSTADGIDLLEALREEPETRGIPVVACTALGERDAASLLPSLGFAGLIAKPFDLLQVARALRAALPARTH